MAKKDTENKQVEEKEETVTFEQPITPEVKVSPEESAPEVKVSPEDVEQQPTKKQTAREKEVSKLADEVDAGKYGTGRERMILLGSNYADVQAEVTRRYKASIKL